MPIFCFEAHSTIQAGAFVPLKEDCKGILKECEKILL